MTSDQTICCSYRNSTSFILFRLTARFARWLVVLLLVFGGFQRGFAQQYPVQVNTFIMPPYSVYLSDYLAPDANNLTVTLNLGDLDFTQYQCKLRVTIEGGNGVLIQTLLGYSPAPITLTGGVPETLYGYDIRQYFNPDNLEFSGIRKTDFLRTGKLPEGFYTFTIEVLDYHRNVVVSNTSLANAWLVLNDPPLINLPFNGEKVRATDPQNIMFSWTPRHTASPNAAFSTEYKFKLVEIYPVGRNPNDAILATNSIYETTTSATALNYGIIEPLLIPGRQYAFQVQAYDIDDRDLFKNSGRSEVYTFQYGDACLAPEGTDADALDPDRLKFSWEPSELHTEFKLRFRQANKDDWYEQQTFNTSLIVPDLIPNTTYEYQVMGSCGSIEGEYSEMGSVTTPETDDDVFACGAASTDFELSTEPLPFPLVPPMNIETADFRVAVKEVSINPDETYNGTGWAMIPWFEMATVRVKFNGIRVNKDFRVYQGNITTIYSNNSQFVMGDDLNELDEDSITGEEDEEIEDPLDDFYDDYDFEDTVKVDYDITDVYTDEDGDIVIVYEDANGEQQEEHIEAGEGDILIEDSNGDQWAVDQDGNVEGNPDNTPDPVDPADVDYLVTFKPNPEQRYGFDAKGDYSMGPYDELEINGQDYVVAWKSVELGRNDYVNVVTDKENFPSEVGFQTPTGKTSSIASASANEKQVVVTGTAPGLEETLDAYVVVEEGEETEELVLGRLNVKTYEQLSERLVIVPVNNVTAPNPEEIATALNKIYKQAVVEWRLSIADRFEIDPSMIDGMMDEASGIFSSFPYPMREFNQAYRDRATQYDDNAYYIFLVEGAHANKAGFMPFKRQFGYIFTDELGGTTIAKAIAHELGHGAFRLRHTFSPEDFKAQEGSTDNLMDYTNGTRLKKTQWDLIHEPGEMNGWFEGDEESAMGEEAFELFYLSVENSMIDPESELRKTVEKIKTIYEFFEKCNDENWASYDGQGIMPYCLWREAESPDIPFTAGIIDGAYLEYEGITQLGPFIEELHDNFSELIAAYTIGYWMCSLENIEANTTEYERVLSRLEELEQESSLWSWVQEKWYEDSREDLDEYWQDCRDIFDLRDNVNETYELITGLQAKEVLDLLIAINDKVEEYLATVASPTNEGYYERGRLVIPVATILIEGVGSLSKMPKVKKALQGMKRMIDEGRWPDFTRKLDELHGAGGLARFHNIRKHLGNSRTKQYLNNSQIHDFEKALKSADHQVLELMDDMDEFNFAEVTRGFKDNPTGFSEVVKDYEKFNGEHGWLDFWKLTPRMENSLRTISELKSGNKLYDVGEATDIQLSSIHAYTVNGNFVNVPFRFNPSWFGKYNSRAVKHINEGLNELRKVQERIYRGDVFSGKTYSRADFESKFVGKMDTDHPYKGYISTSKLESVAEGFVELTKKWAGDGEKVAVIQKITPRSGVYIDDLSDWGKNLGNERHVDANPKVRVQEEVLLNSEKIRQVSEPIPIMENGEHKTIYGLKAYYVNFIEVL